MASAASSKPSRDGALATVSAPTLAEALQRARLLHGEDAGIVESRTVTARHPDGLGQQTLVEVVVAPAGVARALAPRRPAAPAARGAPGGRDLAAALTGEVERIEQLVAAITAGRGAARDGLVEDYPLAAPLQRAGASRAAVLRLAAQFRALPAADRGDGAAALAHLRGLLRASPTEWRGFGGCHAFLGAAGAGKTDLVLGTAARVRAAGQSVLVLSLLPRHGGEIRRLQLEASEHGYDAAVMHRPEQLIENVEHLAGYGAVLLDTPSLFARSLAESGELQSFVAGQASFHRHLVLPLDGDPGEQGELWEAARLWNCDWTALTRVDLCRRPGKLLDLLGRVSSPFSLIAGGPWPGNEPALARPDALLRLCVGAALPAPAAAAATA